MTVEQKGEKLEELMDSIEINPDIRSALSELFYTALETGIIDYKIADDDIKIFQLVKLAIKYKSNLPKNIIM